MIKKFFFILLISSIISDDIKEIVITDNVPVTDPIDLTASKVYKIKYDGKQNYIQVKVSSTSNNPYIIYCQQKECSGENAFFFLNLREKEKSLFIKNNFLIDKVCYIEVFLY